MDGADGMEYEPTQPSISQLRQQQKSERTRRDPSKETSSYSQRATSTTRGNTSQGIMDENNIRQIIAEQLQQLVSPLIEMVNEVSIQNKNLNKTPEPLIVKEQNQMNHPTSINRKRRKFPSWDGETATFNTYIREVEECIEIDRDLMGPDRAIWFDINSSLPTFAKQKVAVFNASGPNIRHDYNQFIAHLKRSFGNRKEKEDKQELLSKIRQKENQRFSDFFPLFEEALIGSGGTGWPDDSKFIWLKRSLSESLRDQLFTVNLNPHEFYESVGKIEEVAYRFEQSRHFKGRKGLEQRLEIPKSFQETTSHPILDSDGDVIMGRMKSFEQGYKTTKRKDSDGRNKGNQLRNIEKEDYYHRDGQKRAALVSQAEIERRKSNNLCIRCGTNNHFVAKCPYLPPKRPQVSIKSTDVDIPPLLEDESEENDFIREEGKA